MKIQPDTLEICRLFMADKEFPESTLRKCVEIGDDDYAVAFELLQKYTGEVGDWWQNYRSNYGAGKITADPFDFMINLVESCTNKKRGANRLNIERDIEWRFNWNNASKVFYLIQSCLDARKKTAAIQATLAFPSLDDFLTYQDPEEED